MNDEYSKIKILLVEDDEALASGLKEALALENMEVETAGTVKDAKRLIGENKL